MYHGYNEMDGQMLTQYVHERENHGDHLERKAQQEANRHDLQDDLPNRQGGALALARSGEQEAGHGDVQGDVPRE